MVIFIATDAQTCNGQGMTVTGVGPVNRSMGGAGTAAPLDASGALHWNPGSISALPQSEVSFGLEGLFADIEFNTQVGGSTASTDGDAGAAVIPSVGWVHHIDGTPFTIGLGVYGIGGFRNNLPVDPSSPILSAGPVFADAEILQIAPTISYRLDERWSVGVAPTLTAIRLMIDPLGPSVITPHPSGGTGNRVHWGGGFQIGVYYADPSFWRAGLTVKSPQWIEELNFNTASGTVRFDIDYPLILSSGLAYYGLQRWVLATDLRYFDYANTSGFSDLGYESVLAGAIGAQYQLSDLWTLRGGYNWNQNPITSEHAFANLSTPLIQTQNVATGVSCRLSDAVDLSLAYIRLMENSLTGPLPIPPFGAGDLITHRVSAHSVAMGLQVRY